MTMEHNPYVAATEPLKKQICIKQLERHIHKIAWKNFFKPLLIIIVGLRYGQQMMM